MRDVWPSVNSGGAPRLGGSPSRSPDPVGVSDPTRVTTGGEGGQSRGGRYRQ